MFSDIEFAKKINRRYSAILQSIQKELAEHGKCVVTPEKFERWMEETQYA